MVILYKGARLPRRDPLYYFSETRESSLSSIKGACICVGAVFPHHLSVMGPFSVTPAANMRVMILMCCALMAMAQQSHDRHLLATVKRRMRSRTIKKADGCPEKSIYILDLNDIAKDNGMPPCDLEKDVKIDPSNGIAFLPEAPHMQPPANSAPTTSATHGAPWWIKQAIATSASVTNDMEEADVIFVYDLCYYQRWLGQVHTRGYVPTDQESEAGKHFMAGYKAVTQLDRWKVNDGADFVFFDPHQGFTDGTSDSEFKKFLCQTSKNSMHIVSERGQLNLCQNYWQLHDKMLIAPYVAGAADVTKPLAHFKEPVLPMAERKWLLHFRGGCLPYGFMFPNQTKIVTGKVARHSANILLRNAGEDVDTHCTDRFLNGQHMSFAELVERMRQSKFCLMLPGDGASSRRTSEIIMTGCVPVWLGPSYATMPFADVVDYKKSALFFNVSQHSMWLDSEMIWENPRDVRPNHIQNPWFWMPDADVKDVMVNVETAMDVVHYLRALPEEKVQSLLDATAVERQKFAYRTSLQNTPSASSIIVSKMCILAGSSGKDDSHVSDIDTA